jgi:hypothetical protein
MSTQQSAVTQHAVVNGIKLAHRRLGQDSSVPLVLMMHFKGNMDFWGLSSSGSVLIRKDPYI